MVSKTSAIKTVAPIKPEKAQENYAKILHRCPLYYSLLASQGKKLGQFFSHSMHKQLPTPVEE